MKKFLPILLFLIIGTMLGSILAVAIPAYNGWVDNIVEPWRPDTSSEPSSSSEEPTSETISLADHPTHTFNAVNSTVTITWEVLPVDAGDKTVVVTISDDTAVDITGTTGTTATFKCLKDFSNSVTAYFTATNGTVTNTDDQVATCVFTFFHALTSIELQLWNDGATPAMNGNSELVTNYADIPSIFEGNNDYYHFEVVITPLNATYQDYTLIATCPNSKLTEGNEDLTMDSTYRSFVNFINYTDSSYELSEKEFQIFCQTMPDEPFEVMVMSHNNDEQDSFVISFGNHLGVGGRVINGTVSGGQQPATPDYSTFGAYLSAYNSAQKTFPVNGYFTITVDEPTWTEYNSTITWDNTKLELIDFEYDNFTGLSTVALTQAAGTLSLDYHSGLPSGTSYIVFKALAVTTGTNVVINADSYSGIGTTVTLPFALSKAVTGITVDHTGYEF